MVYITHTHTKSLKKRAWLLEPFHYISINTLKLLSVGSPVLRFSIYVGEKELSNNIGKLFLKNPLSKWNYLTICKLTDLAEIWVRFSRLPYGWTNLFFTVNVCTDLKWCVSVLSVQGDIELCCARLLIHSTANLISPPLRMYKTFSLPCFILTDECCCFPSSHTCKWWNHSTNACLSWIASNFLSSILVDSDMWLNFSDLSFLICNTGPMTSTLLGSDENSMRKIS